jgi:hypothetical protein
MKTTSPSKGPRGRTASKVKSKPARKAAPKTAPAKRPGGRPQYQPTADQRRQVQIMTSTGIARELQAKILKISPDTLRARFPEELEVGKATMLAEVAGNLFKIATGATAQAAVSAMFIMKTQAGWRETSRHEHSGPGGGPIEHVDLTSFSDDDLATLDAILARAADKRPA